MRIVGCGDGEMTFDQPKPFYTTKGTSTDDILQVRLNQVERDKLNWLKRVLRYDVDATPYKIAFEIGFNVLQSQVGEALLRKISSARRLRPIPGKG